MRYQLPGILLVPVCLCVATVKAALFIKLVEEVLYANYHRFAVFRARWRHSDRQVVAQPHGATLQSGIINSFPHPLKVTIIISSAQNNSFGAFRYVASSHTAGRCRGALSAQHQRQVLDTSFRRQDKVHHCQTASVWGPLQTARMHLHSYSGCRPAATDFPISSRRPQTMTGMGLADMVDAEKKRGRLSVMMMRGVKLGRGRGYRTRFKVNGRRVFGAFMFEGLSSHKPWATP